MVTTAISGGGLLVEISRVGGVSLLERGGWCWVVVVGNDKWLVDNGG